jgi:hypothetical protein
VREEREWTRRKRESERDEKEDGQGEGGGESGQLINRGLPNVTFLGRLK